MTKKPFLPYGRQYLGWAEYRAVRRVLRSPLLTQGPELERFEAALCRATGAPYAVAVSNGTTALALAVQAVKLRWGLADGALGLTSPNTFVASANALLYNRLKPVFCDISLRDYNLDTAKLAEILHREAIELLLPVHFAGQAVDMAAVWQLAQQHNTKTAVGSALRLPIIEDAAHALGSHYHHAADRSAIGSCAYSDACCFSFHPVKSVTTAEGGAVTCKDAELYRLLRLLRNHGLSRQPEGWQALAANCPDEIKEAVPPWYYEMQQLGHNFRLSELHAALGTVQLQRLPSFARHRLRLAQRYNAALGGLPWLRTPPVDAHSCPHIYVLQVDFAHLGISRSAAMRRLQQEGIGTQVHYIPVPMQPYYRKLGYSMEPLPQTAAYYRRALSLPLYAALAQLQQDRVIAVLLQLSQG